MPMKLNFGSKFMVVRELRKIGTQSDTASAWRLRNEFCVVLRSMALHCWEGLALRFLVAQLVGSVAINWVPRLT